MPPRNNFTDVTLVSEDGLHPAAHSVILAPISPRMRTILIKNSRHHPLLYCKGIKALTLMDVGMCGNDYTTLTAIGTHMCMHHVALVNFLCMVCDEDFVTV